MCYAPHGHANMGPTVSKPKIQTQAFLASIPLFKELSLAELEPIAAGTTMCTVPRGEIIVNRGDPCDGFHLVVYGQVKLAFISTEGSEKVVEIVAPGYSFGESSLNSGMLARKACVWIFGLDTVGPMLA